ncbi:glycosyltransferase family 2 protein [Candidatus Pelagibacter sp. HIMB1748]|uniref:glycosyltransferase family 2 protein n=1 Tax=unclassified Candidatus Pelagibacter TaxID=2647897 RepID=UPI003F83D872
MKITIIIPCYNEENTIIEILKKVNLQKKNFDLEIIVSDDGSNDKTIQLLKENKNFFDKLILGKENRGKGAALKEAIKISTGEIIIFQDSDLEYDPEDYKKLIKPFINNQADVVYGSRFMGSSAHRLIYYSHRAANFFLTNLVNIFTNINFTDVETGYKVFRKSTLKKLTLNENSFGIEIELTMKISKMKLKIFEVGISYNGRSYEEGKKIKFRDGLMAVYLIFKYFFCSVDR